MDIKQSEYVKKYLDLFLRRKTFIITLLLLSLPVGLGFYLKSPKVYKASSLLSYQRQKINPNSMSPDVSSRISDIVSTLTQIITSRTNLETIILNLSLYSEARKNLPMEDVIEIMRKKVEITPMRRGDTFTIAFSGSNSDEVAKVANELAAKFIEENLKYREERATETSDYTRDELQMAKQGMDQKENAMRDFKLKYYYEMPDQTANNVARLIALQEQYQNMQGNIQELERTLVLIQEQMNNRKQIIESAISANFDPGANGRGAEIAVSNVQRLAQMESILEQLLLKYTEKHPEVKRTKKLIVKLKKELSLEIDADSPTSIPQPERGTGDSQEMSVDANILQLETQRENVEFSLANVRLERDQLKKQIMQYEKWVSSAPTREAEWSSLTREYGQLKVHYDRLVSQDLAAKSMLYLEKKQKGSQFKIEDPARNPGKPIRPKFFPIIGAAALLSLGVSCGLTFLFDLFDTTFRDEELVASHLGLPLISTIPYIDTGKEVKRRKWYTVFSVGFLGCCSLSILALFFYVWRKGLIVI